jgi:hypothetical protein
MTANKNGLQVISQLQMDFLPCTHEGHRHSMIMYLHTASLSTPCQVLAQAECVWTFERHASILQCPCQSMAGLRPLTCPARSLPFR